MQAKFKVPNKITGSKNHAYILSLFLKKKMGNKKRQNAATLLNKNVLVSVKNKLKYIPGAIINRIIAIKKPKKGENDLELLTLMFNVLLDYNLLLIQLRYNSITNNELKYCYS